jgi:uncharacterized SAM-binding protein YcdF (DUF218 family)
VEERSRAGASIALLIVLVLIAAAVCFRKLGRWLITEDALEPAGAIVILSGGIPYRAAEAAQVYSEKMAPQIWITTPIDPPGLAGMGIAYKGEEAYNQEVLVHEGVPAAAVTILPMRVRNTQDEEEEIFQEMRRDRITKVIVVTSPEHTRRVKAIWRVLAPKDLQVEAHGAPLDPYDPDHWWRTTRDGLAVVRECLGLFNAWTGLRVQSGEPQPESKPGDLQR